MKWLMIFAIVLVGCSSAAQETKRITNEELRELMQDASLQLVDVRTAPELKQGKIGEALHIDFLENDFEERIAKLDKKKPIVVYCAAGGRSAKAAAQLEILGYEKIYDLKNGYNGWE